MLRKIIKIDQTKCDGCGLCVEACHEGAIGLVNDKATLLRDDYCDGLGDCLPACPRGAISFEEREASAYDEAAVKKNMEAKKKAAKPVKTMACGCPGTLARAIERKNVSTPTLKEGEKVSSHLNQWPVQIKLVAPNAPYLQKAHLLIAADCTAYAYGSFHEDFMKHKITLIACPKLDDADYSEKLAAIIATNDIQSVTVVRMEVPCCGGLVEAVKKALQKTGKIIPWQVKTISTQGEICPE